MAETYRVTNKVDNCPASRRFQDGSVPEVRVVFDGREYPVIPPNKSTVLEQAIAEHAKGQYPWLELHPATAVYVEEATPAAAHTCPLCPAEKPFASNDFAAYSEHIATHANDPKPQRTAPAGDDAPKPAPAAAPARSR